MNSLRSTIDVNAYDGDILPMLRECGAAILVNHGVDEGTLSEGMATCRRIHRLSQAQKSQIAIMHSPGFRGYFSAEDITPESRHDVKAVPPVTQRRTYHSFEFGSEDLHPSTIEDKVLFAPNQMPDEKAISQSVSAYVSAMLSLSTKVERLLGTMDIFPGALFTEHERRPFYQLRMLEYPPTPTASKARLGAHTDYECFTLLQQSEPGLEVMTRAGEWLEVPTRAGDLLLLVGDLLEAASEGVLESVLHRVRASREVRHSVAFFKGIDTDVVFDYHLAGEPKRLRVGDHLLGRAVQNFPHLSAKVTSGEIIPPKEAEGGNPFRATKLNREKADRAKPDAASGMSLP